MIYFYEIVQHKNIMQYKYVMYTHVYVYVCMYRFDFKSIN